MRRVRENPGHVVAHRRPHATAVPRLDAQRVVLAAVVRDAVATAKPSADAKGIHR